MTKLILILSSLLLLISCSSEDSVNTPEIQEVTFSFSQQSRDDLNSSTSNQLNSTIKLSGEGSSFLSSENNENLEPFALIISILNSENDVILNNQELLLSSTDGVNFISEPVDLDVGDYSITTFNVINSENQVIFASPFEDSEIAESTNSPLPIPFSVDRNTTENNTPIVTPEVILVLDTDTPEQFGFASFSFDIIERQSLFISATESTNEIISGIAPSYTLTVENSDFTLAGTLEVGTNTLSLPLLINNTEISITLLHDSVSQTQTFIAGQITDYTESNPLVINFVNEVPITTPIPTFTYSSDPNYLSQTFTNTTPNTSSVQWTLPTGTTLINGSLSDEEIEVRFPNSGNFNIGLEVTSVGIDENGDPAQLTGESTREVPIVTSFNEIIEPFIIAGDFENPDDFLIAIDGFGRNDLAKEYWIADGVSTRVLDPRTFEPFIAFPGVDPELERSWFGNNDLFNRISVSFNGRFGKGASWDVSQPDPRTIVQRIDIIPGVDYRITFWYSNDLNVTDISLVGAILKDSVINENQRNMPENIITQESFNETADGFVQASLSFTVVDTDAEAVKLYFNTSENAGDYRLDDISIAID